MRRLLRRCLAAASLATVALSVWALAQNPFAAPLILLSAQDASAALDRALIRHASDDWIAAEIDAAIRDADRDRLDLALDLAERRGMRLSDAQIGQIAGASWPGAGWRDCAACAWEPSNCASLRAFGRCALPVEFTPLGDLNALRRAATAHMADEPVDHVDVVLATTGLAASGAILITAGTSAGIKAGSTTLRLARRAGALRPTLGDEIADLARRAVRTKSGVDPVAAAGLRRITDDVGTLARRTSATDAIDLMRHADGADELRLVAHAAEAQGPATRATFHALGKARIFRAMHRLTEAALATIALLGALAAQLLALALWLGRRALR